MYVFVRKDLTRDTFSESHQRYVTDYRGLNFYEEPSFVNLLIEFIQCHLIYFCYIFNLHILSEHLNKNHVTIIISHSHSGPGMLGPGDKRQDTPR